MVFGSREMVSGHRSMVLPGSDMPSALGLVSYAYALYFINHCFGSLFWQGSLLGPYFTKSWVPISKLGGPY